MKQNLRTREWLEITDAKQAAVLLEDKTLHFLTPFVGIERSADEAAALLNVNLNTLLYQIKRLRKFKLLQLVRTQKRQGSSIKMYRASADTFFVPFPATPYTQPEDLLLREYEPLHRRLLVGFLEAGIEFVGSRSVNDFGLSVQLGHGGLHVNHGPNPRLGLTVNPTVPHAPAILNQWQDLKLDFEDAKALQREMMTLLERYRTKSGSGAYLAHVGLAPTNSRA
jgi:hypothetical protein